VHEVEAGLLADVPGLVCLELYKAVQKKKIEAYRNTFANLALPLFAMAEPIPPKVFKFNGMEWSLWDRWILEGDLTVQQVIDWFKVAAPSTQCVSAAWGGQLKPGVFCPGATPSREVGRACC
jgi:hypothetical protein